MKSIYLTLLIIIAISKFTFAQWTTSGSNIYNSNAGYVGIGTTSPTSKLHLNLSSQSGLTIGGNSSSFIGSDLYIYRSNSGENVGASPAMQFNDIATGYQSLIQSFQGQLQFFNAIGGGWVERMRISSNGNVGIGTATPSAALQIGNFTTSSTNQLLIPGTYNFEQVRLGQIGNGNAALEFINHLGVTDSYGIKFLINTDSSQGLQIQYAPSSTTYSGLSYTTGFFMSTSGNIGIGTITPDTKLAVNGTIHAKEIKVNLTSWPDYVFKPTYTHQTLKAVKTYIDQNHHLPDMPSEQEVVKNGLNLGEMNALLTKKIEELTIYLIEKDNQLKTQGERLKKVEVQQKVAQIQLKEVDQLKRQIVKLIKR